MASSLVYCVVRLFPHDTTLKAVVNFSRIRWDYGAKDRPCQSVSEMPASETTASDFIDREMRLRAGSTVSTVTGTL